MSLRRFIPRPIISGARVLETFLRQHAHDKTIDGMPVDAQGQFIPWLTYPILEFLDGLDLSSKTVFEFGCGGSTFYWAARTRQVTSVELDQAWFNQLRPRVPKNVTLIHEPDGHKYAAKISEQAGKFDIIVIDGAERYRSAQAALTKLADGGMIVLDNAEWYPNCCRMLAAAELIEVPFSGFSPINAFTSTSSAFLSRHFRYERRQRRPPIGGRALQNGALDDGV